MSKRTPPRLAKRTLHCEPLEARQLLAGDGLVEVGTQPDGGLSDKIVYVHGGHGWKYNSSSHAWGAQRPELFEMVEDLGNRDQMNFLVDYLFRAGATVVPLRPVGYQTNEVVLDNDDAQVSFSGAWSDSSSSTFFGDPGDVPYRYASSSAVETARARYRPTIPEDGFYPVYAWTRPGSDRVADQLYRIRHTGGIQEVTINHRRVGNGWVYLGSYYFRAGTEAYVDVSNRSNASGVVIADAIRFGNGMGDTDLGGGVSGKPREDEAGLYWIQSQFGQGTSTGGITGTVSAPPRWAAQMNRSSDGSMTDRLFFSFHSNAGGGTARGTLALYNGNNDPATATPNQLAYAQLVGREVNDDLVALNGQFEHNWRNRTTVTLDRSDIEFGEINNLYINGEFDATILEVAFHDNQQDAQLMRDPKVRDAVARASYQGMVRYFNQYDGSTPVLFLPDPVSDVRAIADGSGSITVAWQPPIVDGIGGDAPTGYRIYTSLDGFGFDGGTYVPGGETTSTTFTDLDAASGRHYFRVVAVNDGGESKRSEVVASQPIAGSRSAVLIVNGFDRLGRSQNFREPFGGEAIDRVRTRYANTQDYSVQVAEAVEAFSPEIGVDTAANEAVIGGQVDLTNYGTLIWIVGEESSADSTFDAAEQTLVAAFVNQGGNLFLSGTEIGWDLDFLNNGRNFYNDLLLADYVADDANTYTAEGETGSLFEGLTVTFDDGTRYYDAEFPDVIAPRAGASTALTYVGGTGGVAAIQAEGSGDSGNVVMLGFPFETIVDPAVRAEMMTALLTFFGVEPPDPVILGDMDFSGRLDFDDIDDFVLGVSSSADYEAIYGVHPSVRGDMNGDGDIDFDDIDPFVAALTAAMGGRAALAADATDNSPGGLTPASGQVSTERSIESGVWFVIPARTVLPKAGPARQSAGHSAEGDTTTSRLEDIRSADDRSPVMERHRWRRTSDRAARATNDEIDAIRDHLLALETVWQREQQ